MRANKISNKMAFKVITAFCLLYVSVVSLFINNVVKNQPFSQISFGHLRKNVNIYLQSADNYIQTKIKKNGNLRGYQGPHSFVRSPHIATNLRGYVEQPMSVKKLDYTTKNSCLRKTRLIVFPQPETENWDHGEIPWDFVSNSSTKTK